MTESLDILRTDELLMKRQRAVARMLETVDGKVFWLWLGRDVCRADMDAMPVDANPIMLAFNTGRKSVYEAIEREIAKSEIDRRNQAITLQLQQDYNDAEHFELGLWDDDPDERGEA